MRNYMLFISFFFVSEAVKWSGISAPPMLTGSLGAPITVRCQYDLLYKDHPKYWCEGAFYELCRIVVKTTEPRENDKASIQDDRENGVFTVTMKALQWRDGRQYWCVVSRKGRNIFAGVFLKIVEEENIITAKPEEDSKTPDGWSVLRWIMFAALLACSVTLGVYTKFPGCRSAAKANRCCLRFNT
ncbi:hypothetical protein GN956_G9737 [Arapaima gigas]